MDFILILVGMAMAVWAISMLFTPPKKHKEFTLHDQDQATIRALGRSGTPDILKLKPEESREKRKKHNS